MSEEKERDPQKEEYLKKSANFHMDLAQQLLDDLMNSINSCDIIGAYPIFSNIHINTNEARKNASGLPDPQWKELSDRIKFIEADSFEIIDSILKKCDCKPKEPFKYVTELPKD